MSPNNTIPCATCGATADFFAPPIGPFCSSRCQSVDLGRWLSEDYRISEPLDYDEIAEFKSHQSDKHDLSD